MYANTYQITPKVHGKPCEKCNVTIDGTGFYNYKKIYPVRLCHDCYEEHVEPVETESPPHKPFDQRKPPLFREKKQTGKYVVVKSGSGQTAGLSIGLLDDDGVVTIVAFFTQDRADFALQFVNTLNSQEG